MIQNATLPPDTLVWREGMADWVKANTLPEFSAANGPASAPTTAIVSVPSGAEIPKPAPVVPPASSGPSMPPPPGAAPVSSSIAAEKADIEQNKVFAVLAYIGLLFLVPLLAAPKSRFARFHTNQGIVLFLASVGAYIAAMIVAFGLSFIPFLGCLGVALLPLILLTALVFTVMGIINAASGLFKPLPLIGKFELMKTDPNP